MTWDELVVSALVGTARRPPAMPDAAPGSALAHLLDGIDAGEPEAAVLEAGAALGLYRLAGARPSQDAGAPLDACPPEIRPHCSAAAAFRLDAMLTGRFDAVLGEWLGLVSEAGRLVPPDRLPALLDTATSSPGLRTVVADVAGERGRWLGGLHPAWAWIIGGGPDDAAVWATGSPGARRLLLGRLRQTAPAAARALVESTWGTETPEDRAAFVAALATGLSMDDEPFLEAALDDRRKEVRLAAADLLYRLPGSRLGARMAERARPLALPEALDASMVRDGIVAKPPPGVGARAWWLQQIVAATPLDTWSDAEPPPFRHALAVAAARQRDERWALALLAAGEADVPALLGVIAHDRAVRVATERVTRDGLTQRVLDLLDHCPLPWGRDPSTAVVQRLGTAVRSQARPDHDAIALRTRMGSVGLRLDPSVAPAAAVELAEHAPWWSDVVGWFLDLLTFRAEMREELRS